ncbi:bile acid:sodium symporter family protein [Rubritalea sp.]|uniref:bile acid:sodium symporter family protein n=1 Tax=Rubritalea sp. TaxID=2109375 RepID=UPI003EF48B35
MFEKIIEIALPIALILVMTGVGIGMKPSDLARVAKFPKAFFIGAICQLVLLPLLAIGIISGLGMSGLVAIGVLVIALCPGGVTSNLFSYLAKGDVGLSVCLTAIIGFITPFTIPLVVSWGLSWQGLDNDGFSLPVVSTVVKLLVISVIPVIIGMGIRKFLKEKLDVVENVVRRGSIGVFLLVIAAGYFELGAENFTSYALQAGPACLLINLGGMAIGFGIALLTKLNRAQRMTIMLEVGLQNGLVALTVTQVILENAQMSIAPIVYSLWMMVPAALVVYLSKFRGRAGDGDVESVRA